MVQVSYDALADGKTTVTFAYMPVSQADFVKHTVNFVLTLPGGTEQPLYTHEKLIPKGTGNQVVYKEDDVKYTVPGYAYQGISYKVGSNSVNAADVKDNVNATITYRFTEASAWIKINQECVGGSATPNPDHNATQTLTGYREGQENVVIIAPVLKDHALKSDQPMSYTFSKLKTGENEHTFQYVKAGNTHFVLKEIGTDTRQRPVGCRRLCGPHERHQRQADAASWGTTQADRERGAGRNYERPSQTGTDHP